MNDYLFLINHNISENVEYAFDKYQPYIVSRAKICYGITKNYLIEDFLQQTFLELYYFIEKIDINKITENNKFDFYIYVYYATCRIFNSLNLKNKQCFDYIEIDYFKYMSDLMLYDKLKSSLTKRQNFILNDKMKYIHERETLNKLKISHALYNYEMQIIKKQFNKFNY